MRARLFLLFAAFATVAACNGLLGIEEAELRGPDASGDGASDGDAASDGATGDAASDGEGGLGPLTCTVLGPRDVGGQANPLNGPALAYLGGPPPRWALVWQHGSTIYYAVADFDGNSVQGATRVVDGGDYGSFPQATSSGTSLAVAYGLNVQGGPATSRPVLQLVAPDGGVISAPVDGLNDSFAVPPHIGAVAANGSQIVIASRRGNAVANTNPTATFVAGTTPGPARVLSLTGRATSLAFAPDVNRYGLAYVVDGTESGGQIAQFGTDTNEAVSLSFAFTAAGDVPQLNEAQLGVGIAAVQARYAVAWVDARSSLAVYLTMVDATSGARPFGERVVSVIDAQQKLFPKVVFDGLTIDVAWIENETGSRYRAMLRQYSPDLVPLGDARCMNCGGANLSPRTTIGLAAGGIGVVGIAFTLDGKQQLNRLLCTQ